MDIRSEIESILTIAVHAPSGDNAQPWRFRLADHSVCIFNIPERDATLYNYEQRGSYLAHGALIENICIVSKEKGFATFVELFPGDDGCVAKISFTPTDPVTEPLYSGIKRRSTNRKPYEKRSLTLPDRSVIEKCAAEWKGIELRLVEGESVQFLATAVSVNERLLFENKELHDFLFGMIRWTEEEERAKPGLYVRTMEFPAPLRFLLKHVFSNFVVVRILNYIGLSRAIPKSSSQIYRASSAMGAIVIPGDAPEDYLAAGRALQRLWLRITNMGMSMQPVTAIPYLAARIADKQAGMFTEAHQKMVLDANTLISTSFNMQPGERIAMLFRLGYDGEPTARSAKMSPNYE